MAPARSLAAGLTLLASVFSASSGIGQEQETNPDPVYVFNRICYAQIHDLPAIQDMALKLVWRTMPDAELEEFRPAVAPTILDGWDVQVGERLFKLGIAQSPVSESMLKIFPDFVGGTSSTCSIILDDQQLAAEFMPNMKRLVGKEPVSSGVAEGPLQTTTWAGGNADIKVFVFAKHPPTGKGGLLNVTLLQKKK